MTTAVPSRVQVHEAQWLLTLVPAFPLMLLVLRLWYLSRQDMPTMLLLVQYVSPLGLLSALVITLVWVLPVVVLMGRMLGMLLLVSARNRDEASRSWPVRASLRMPGWVVLVAVVLAALTWQLRFLPALLMAVVSIAGLAVRERFGSRGWRGATVCVVLPLLAVAASYVWLGPAVVYALDQGEELTALLLIVPLGLSPLLTGPLPARLARLVIHWPSMAAALLVPFLAGAIFLRAPILPSVAIEVDDGGATNRVVRGDVITVNDRMTIVLDSTGTVQFLINDLVVSETLCPEAREVPTSKVEVHGWQVEQTSLEWIAPSRGPQTPDTRCQGRPEPAG